MDLVHRFTFAVLALSTVLAAACMGGEADSSGTPLVLVADAGAEAAVPKADGAPPSDAERGAGYVHARGCVRCHQSEDPADGVLSGSTRPRPGSLAFPRNLTPDSDTGLGEWSDRLILRAIREGVDDDGAPLCATMPRYVDMDDDEGAAIVAYLRGLPPIHHAIPESHCGDEPADAGPGLDAAAPDLDAGRDAGDSGDAMVCVGLAAPGTKSTCHACGLRPCQPNGCYGGYVCDTRASTCHPLPVGCSAS
jgi:hypothetical protein